ncbi:biliverdin-producing heme oxygenase [Okibacterium endophyticum]
MTGVTPFSEQLKERTRSVHSDSEGAGFINDLMRGDGTRADYVALVVQHWYIYDALERIASDLADDPVAAPFLDDALIRTPAIELDLDYLVGPNWRDDISPLTATRAYVDRINAVADWPGGVIAHHYTRYLGDLSGGQFIARLMRRHLGLGDDGVRFYTFDIDDLAAFKNAYRAKLDHAPWDADERERFIDEVVQAYALNTRLFEDLAAVKAGAAA